MNPWLSRLALRGKGVLISGGSRHLGEAVARKMASLGASVAINHWQDGEKAEALARELSEQGTACVAAEMDVSQSEEVKRLVAQAVQAIGPVDVLVHCAGPFAMSPFARMEESEWDAILGVNLKGAYLLTREVAPIMKKRGWDASS